MQGRKSVGHPIDVASGEQYTAWHDLEVPGIIPLRFRRYYGTSVIDHPGATLGKGWTHEYQMALVRDLDGYRYYGHDGETIEFEDPGDVVNAGGRLLNLESAMEIRREGDRYALYHWHDWQSEVRKFMFKAGQGFSMPLDAIELPSGHSLVMGYDDKGRVASVRQSVEKRRLTFDYDDQGRIRRLNLHHPAFPSRLVAEYGYDPLGRLVGVRDANAQVMAYGYDAQHRLVMERGRAGGTYHMRYDAKGRCVESVGDNGYKRASLVFDGKKMTTTTFDSLNNATVHQMNKAGQIVEEIHPDGGKTLTGFDDLGRVVSRTGPMGDATEFEYDAKGDMIRTKHPNGSELKLEYNDFHQPVKILQSSGLNWELVYADGLVVAVIGPTGTKEEYAYDKDRILVEARYPTGAVVRFDHDAEWTMETTTDDYGLVETARYDIFMNAVEAKEGVGGIRKIEYDAVGLLKSITMPDGGRNTYQRDPEGRLIAHTNANGVVTRHEWNPYGLHLGIKHPTGTEIRQEYDSEGRLAAIVNEKGEKAEMRYDSCGRLVSVRAFDGREDAYRKDVGGRVIGYKRPDGVWLSYERDMLGNLLKVSRDKDVLAAYAYDAHGNLLSAETPDCKQEYVYDGTGRLLAEIQDGIRTEMAYHPDGSLASRHFQGGRIGPLGFSFDKRARLHALTEGGKEVGRFTFDASDNLIQRDFPGGTERLSFDPCGRMVSQRVLDRDFLELLKRDFKYDPESNLIETQDRLRGTAEYGYDARERLTVVRRQGHETVHYHYDACSNLLGREGESPWQYGPGNKLLRQGRSAYTWDANARIESVDAGNQVTRYHWNDLGRLEGITFPDGSRAKYGYDATGRRVFKEVKGVRTEFFWFGNDLMCERQGDQVLDYAVGASTPALLWDNKRLLVPILTTPGLLTEVLDEYGQMVWQGNFNEWGRPLDKLALQGPALRFPGQYWDDESGLHYNRFRYYDPWQGRYISADPMGLEAGLNEFMYGVNPVNWTDPLGLFCGKKSQGKYKVYVLTKGQPPQIVYVGITKQDPAKRCQQHKNNKKDFDNMVVVDHGMTYRQARNLEGSALNAANNGTLNNVHPNGLQNAPRNPSNPGFYHSYYDGDNRIIPATGANNVNDRLDFTNPNMPVHPKP